MLSSSIAVHRLNTYVFIHNGLLHMTLNVLALTPLLERFESEHGTLTTLLTFLGREYRASFLIQPIHRFTTSDTYPSFSVFDNPRRSLSAH